MPSVDRTSGYEYVHNERPTNRSHFQLDAVESIQSQDIIWESNIFGQRMQTDTLRFRWNVSTGQQYLQCRHQWKRFDKKVSAMVGNQWVHFFFHPWMSFRFKNYGSTVPDPVFKDGKLFMRFPSNEKCNATHNYRSTIDFICDKDTTVIAHRNHSAQFQYILNFHFSWANRNIWAKNIAMFALCGKQHWHAIQNNRVAPWIRPPDLCTFNHFSFVSKLFITIFFAAIHQVRYEQACGQTVWNQKQKWHVRFRYLRIIEKAMLGKCGRMSNNQWPIDIIGHRQR